MRLGSTGSSVLDLQLALNIALGGNLPLTGFFGQDTQQAVMAFQQANGLLVDGIVGRYTLSALYRGKKDNLTNVKAFLDTIAFAEGTIRFGSNNGYNVIVGGSLFTSYADHPRKRIFIKNINNYSTAAGRYQLLSKYFDYYRHKLDLPDFSPNSQDVIAIQQIKEQGAYQDVRAGRVKNAINKVRNIWASFPGAGYGQPEKDLVTLISYYQSRGGLVKG